MPPQHICSNIYAQFLGCCSNIYARFLASLSAFNPWNYISLEEAQIQGDLLQSDKLMDG